MSDAHGVLCALQPHAARSGHASNATSVLVVAEAGSLHEGKPQQCSPILPSATATAVVTNSLSVVADHALLWLAAEVGMQSAPGQCPAQHKRIRLGTQAPAQDRRVQCGTLGVASW